jgi:hypothetical protein
MKVKLESTDKIVTLQIGACDVKARVWEGVTESGITVHAFITRIAVEKTEDTSQFEKELQECRPASAEIKAIPLRLII